MRLTIAKVDEILFVGEAESVTLPGTEGEMTIYQDHEAFVTTLKVGIVTIRGAIHETKLSSPATAEQQHIEISVTSGVVEVNPSGVTVIL